MSLTKNPLRTAYSGLAKTLNHRTLAFVVNRLLKSPAVGAPENSFNLARQHKKVCASKRFRL